MIGIPAILNNDGDFASPIVDGERYRRFIETLPRRGFLDNDVTNLKAGLENCFAKFARLTSSSNLPRTNLLVGDVQSGKTTAIEGLISLASDNNFKLVVLLTGRSTALSEQSQTRIFEGLDDIGGISAFRIYRQNDLQQLLSDIENIESSALSNFTIIYTLLKDHHYLAPLVAGIENLQIQSKRFEILIIDDEADQASPDTRVNNPNQPASTTHGLLTKLIGIDSIIPGVCTRFTTYLQVTATPTGIFLIAPPSLCTPCYTSSLLPGTAYIGIKPLFFNLAGSLLANIPDNETPDNWVNQNIPPSLHEAFDWYLVTYAVLRSARSDAGSTAYYPDDKPLSMLCHPLRTRDSHQMYEAWLRGLLAQYSRDLNDSFGRDQLLFRLRETYSRIVSQFQDFPPEYIQQPSFIIPDWDSNELQRHLEEAINTTQIKLINTDNSVDDIRQFWRVRSVIVCGGDGVGRGFTFEGLTTTYLGRPVGNNPNADTVQQRARFCGYRRRILPFIKIYLSNDNRALFENYVITEDVYRRQIARFETRPYGHIGGDELRLHLSGAQPSRQNIYSTPNTQNVRRFFQQLQPHLISNEDREANIHHTTTFLSTNALAFSVSDNQVSPFFDRLNATVSLSDAHSFLIGYKGIFDDGIVLDYYRALLGNEELRSDTPVRFVLMQNRNQNQQVRADRLVGILPTNESLLSAHLGVMRRGHRNLFHQMPTEWNSISLRDMKLTGLFGRATTANSQMKDDDSRAFDDSTCTIQIYYLRIKDSRNSGSQICSNGSRCSIDNQPLYAEYSPKLGDDKIYTALAIRPPTARVWRQYWQS